MKTVQQIRQERLEYLHRDAAREDRLRKQGWVLYTSRCPDPGLYEVWIKHMDRSSGIDKFGRYLNFDGHSWYGEMWNWVDEEVYAWRVIRG